MATFYYLKASKQYVNLDHVALVTEKEDGSVAVSIFHREKDETLEAGNEAQNFLERLKAEAKKGGMGRKRE
jgi:hypothetical protein